MSNVTLTFNSEAKGSHEYSAKTFKLALKAVAKDLALDSLLDEGLADITITHDGVNITDKALDLAIDAAAEYVAETASYDVDDLSIGCLSDAFQDALPAIEKRLGKPYLEDVIIGLAASYCNDATDYSRHIRHETRFDLYV